MAPIYAGENRALCRLKSGEYICVDTNSLDSIDYLLGFEMEADVMPVFQRFLTPSSVVLDIGANAGLYTVTAATVTQHHGRIYAFEGNPHTFNLLRRSVYANRHLTNPRITLVNALVGDRAGRGKLYYDPEFLGSATMRDVSHLYKRWRAVEQQVVTIDDLLPASLGVDLVKIDVEGYEPFVLKGMERTIARSPNIRLIIEFIHGLVDPVFGADTLIGSIRNLGLEICEIKPGGRLVPLEEGRETPGDCYLFLTRTLQEDVARDYFVMPMAGFCYPEVCGLEKGEFAYDRERQPPSPGNVLIYGPYRSLAAGRYAFLFVGDIDGRLRVNFTSRFGRITHKTEIIESFAEPSIVHLPELAEQFEIVMQRTDSLNSIRLSEVRVTMLP